MADADPDAEGLAAETAPPDEAALPPGAEFYLTSFWDLVHDRAPAMGGVTGIPFTAIDAYARRIRLPEGAFADFFAAIRACDSAFIAVMNEQIERASKTKGAR